MREFPTAAPPGQPGRQVYSVSSLTRRIRELLEFELPQVWVEGEISNLSRPASGHVYFSLKDERSQIRCALFRGRGQSVPASLANGDQVLVRARLTLYEARGDTQLVVQYLEDAGEGALLRAFEALKRKLRDEGLFDERHKRPLPTLPARVGIITSPSGAAVRDIIVTFRRRFPAIPLLIYPAPVQGEQAVDDICAMLRTAERHQACDVLILARGGGSLEDLQAFNDERLARAVFACSVPVVCGVGHESDITICDFVADRRATTPTAAAELISPNASEWLEALAGTEARLARCMGSRLEQLTQRIDWLNRMIVHPHQQLRGRAERLQRAFAALAGSARARLQASRIEIMAPAARLAGASPAARLMSLRDRLTRLDDSTRRTVRATIETRHQRLDYAMSRLEGANPVGLLRRGYTVVTRRDSGAMVKSAAQVAAGDRVDIRLADGRLHATIETTRPDHD